MNINNLKGIVDTGTSVIVGPKSLVDNILSRWDNPKSIDCATLDQNPSLEFVIGGKSYVLEPKDYVLKVCLMKSDILFCDIRLLLWARLNALLV